MAVNYNDYRFQQVENEKQSALNEVNTTYNDMINKTDKLYEDQINASKDWEETQKKLQQEQTDLAIEKINQNKEWAEQDYLKEQKASYVDYQKQTDPYGNNAEQMASLGLTGTGYAESSKVAMYTAYQNRVSTARESFNRAVVNYDLAIKDAITQNNSALAEIGYQALQTQLQLSLEGFQYKNQLLQQQLQTKHQTEDRYYSRWQDVLNQINTENTLAEQQRQFNQQMALQQSELALKQRELALQEQAYTIAKESSSGGSGGSSSGSSSSGSASINKSSSSGGTPVGATTNGTSVKSGGTMWYTLAGSNFDKLGLSGAPSQSKIDSLIASGKLEAKVIDGKMYYRKP